MTTYSDIVKIATAADETEVTGTLTLPNGAHIIEITLACVDADGLPYQVRLDYPGIKTPQKYCTGIIGLPAVSPGGPVKIPVDLVMQGTALIIGISSEAAAATSFIGIKWIAP